MKFLLLYVSLFVGSNKDKPLTLDEIRGNYASAVANKEICRLMINELSEHQQSHVHLAYLGAFQTIWAKHVFNPLTKLHTFNKGRRNIEKAVSSAPKNVEIIGVRYSVQKHCPRFLGYSDMLEKDRNYLINQLPNIVSAALKKMVEVVLKS